MRVVVPSGVISHHREVPSGVSVCWIAPWRDDRLDPIPPDTALETVMTVQHSCISVTMATHIVRFPSGAQSAGWIRDMMFPSGVRGPLWPLLALHQVVYPSLAKCI